MSPILKHLSLAIALAITVARSASAAPCPNIMFVLDQSGSMDGDPNGGSRSPTKWELLQAAVIDIVTQYGDQVPFGLQLYTSNGWSDAECYNETKIDVEPGHDTAMDIINRVRTAMPEGGTNTGDAIKRAMTSPSMSDPSRGQYIVLVTDGDPNCNGNEPGFTVDQIRAAANRNPPVHTFVVGFDGSGGVSPENLNNMARAGLVPADGCTAAPGSTCYYSASNASKFQEAINKIVNQVLGGEFGTIMCDDSCYSNGCDPGYVCTSDELDPNPHCAPDPCFGVSGNCAPGDYCRLGQCVHACTSPCRTNERCIDGTCVIDACATANCAGDTVCNPATGQCIVNPCIGRICRAPSSCDPGTGQCTDDLCRLVSCPPGFQCRPGGNCEALTNSGTHTRTAPGCGVGGGDGTAGVVLAVVLLMLFGPALFARRSRP